MDDIYNFYYDENGHTRVITEKAINDDQFFIYFSSSIIGWKQIFEEQFNKDYLKFEEKYKKIYSVKELKSSIIKSKKYEFGLYSFNDSDIDFLNDYADIILDDNIFIHFSFFNKYHLLISKGLYNIKDKNIRISPLAYSISKFIEVYRPSNVIHALYEKNLSKFKIEFSNFLIEMINKNKNVFGKESENHAILQVLTVIDKIKLPTNYDFFYDAIFAGFYNFLDEVKIDYLVLMIDKEGSGKTLHSASKFFNECYEVDSNESFGIRCADLCTGLFGRLLNSIAKTFHPKNQKEVPLKRLLPANWFDIDEKRFLLYKKLKKILIDKNNVYDKIFSSCYSDDLLYLIDFLSYLDSFQTIDEFMKTEVICHQESLNSFVNESLRKRFDMLGFND